MGARAGAQGADEGGGDRRRRRSLWSSSPRLLSDSFLKGRVGDRALGGRGSRAWAGQHTGVAGVECGRPAAGSLRGGRSPMGLEGKEVLDLQRSLPPSSIMTMGGFRGLSGGGPTPQSRRPERPRGARGALFSSTSAPSPRSALGRGPHSSSLALPPSLPLSRPPLPSLLLHSPGQCQAARPRRSGTTRRGRRLRTRGGEGRRPAGQRGA